MKILQLCYKPPYPPVDGGTLAMNSLTEGMLSHGCEVRVLTVASEKHPVIEERIPAIYREQTRFEAIEVDLSVRAMPAAKALLCGESYNVERFESREMRERLRDILREESYDVVQVESIYMAPYLETIRKHSKACVVLRAHNVEYRIWKQRAQHTKNALKRWYIKKLALALRTYELERLNQFDGVVCISHLDAEQFRADGCRKPMTVVPFGIKLPEVSAVRTQHDMLFYIGSMDWQPNIEGVEWFLDQVWPEIHKEMPELRLVLAGRRTPEDLSWKYWNREDVEIRGEVENATTFISEGFINVVPLLSGSGIRVKIIEAMSHGKPVVTTTIGAQGIQYTDGDDLLIADTPETFVAQVKKLRDNPEKAKEIGENARRLIEKEYEIHQIAGNLIEFYEGLL